MNSRTSQAATRHAMAVKELLQELEKHVTYFSKRTSEERGILRRICLRNRMKYGMVLTETRQLLREERNYQDWREMNGYGAGAITRLSEDADQ